MTTKTLNWIRISTLGTACALATACSEPADDGLPMDLAEDTDGMDEPTDGEDPDACPPNRPDCAGTSGPEPDPEPDPDPDPEPEPDPDPDPDPEPDPEPEPEPEPEMAEDDGDFADNPAVRARLRATSGAPVRVEGPLFNEDPLDVRGLQYADAVSIPGDDFDVVSFDIVPGEVDPTIRIELTCDLDEPARLQATLVRDGVEVIDTIVCGEGEVSVLLDQASSLDEYTVEVQLAEGDDALSDYALSINGFCFQQCNYTLYGM